jgi:hypothetical protein
LDFQQALSFSGPHQTKRASGRAQVPEALARTILENLVPSSVLRQRRLNEKAPRKSGSGLLGRPIATDGKRWFLLLIGTSATPAETKRARPLTPRAGRALAPRVEGIVWAGLGERQQIPSHARISTLSAIAQALGVGLDALVENGGEKPRRTNGK